MDNLIIKWFLIGWFTGGVIGYGAAVWARWASYPGKQEADDELAKMRREWGKW